MKARWITLMLLAAGSVGAWAQQFVTDGLVAMYTFDKNTVQGEVVQDVFGGNDAKLVGNLELVDGVIGEAFQFDGNPNYVEIPALGDWPEVSVECWAMEDSFGGIQGIVSTWQWAAGKVHFKFESNQIQVHKNDGVKIVYPNPEAGVWYHIVYTTDTGANELKLYVNGELAAEGTSGATPENMNERRVGSEHDGRYLIGKVDEVRLYNRVLTPEEVAQNYNAQSNSLSVDPRGKLTTTWGALRALR
ncbi:MAG: hypothetical protein KatS3mg115_0347 [Candidatus Poribacteria bacterium]|nr:MAG: hypothetical protein KatS3mg115_0347 [Candidatus Poribacteria bacterium]